MLYGIIFSTLCIYIASPEDSESVTWVQMAECLCPLSHVSVVCCAVPMMIQVEWDCVVWADSFEVSVLQVTNARILLL